MQPHEQLAAMVADGSLAALDRAMQRRERVQIKRTSGKMVEGWIAALGHAGLSAVVVWGAEDWTVDVAADLVRCGPGSHCKKVRTSELLEWNPKLRSNP